MRIIVLATALAASIVATAMSAQANTYVDPSAAFDAQKFFNSLPTGQ